MTIGRRNARNAGQTIIRKTLPCQVCGKTLRASFSIANGAPEGFASGTPKDSLKYDPNTSHAHFRMVCEHCGYDAEAISCLNHAVPMHGKLLRAKVFMRSEMDRQRLRKLNKARN